MMPYIGAGLLVLCGAVGYFLYQRSQPGKTTDRETQQGLFLELCDLHLLEATQRKALWGLVQKYELAHPAILFVDGTLLQRAIDEHPEENQYSALQQKLFAA